MRAVGIKVLKNRLSEYVRAAAGGETVLVLDRERVVAELGPPSSDRPRTAPEAWLADAIKRGVIRPPVAPLTELPERFPSMKLDDIVADLAESRRDRDLP